MTRAVIVLLLMGPAAQEAKGVVLVRDLPFPIWIVTQRRGLLSQPVEPDGMKGYAAAFSNAEDAATFMVARGETAWETTLVVGRATLGTLLADLRRIGVQGLCLDPDGSGCGEAIPLDQLDTTS